MASGVWWNTGDSEALSGKGRVWFVHVEPDAVAVWQADALYCHTQVGIFNPMGVAVSNFIMNTDFSRQL